MCDFQWRLVCDLYDGIYDSYKASNLEKFFMQNNITDPNDFC